MDAYSLRIILPFFFCIVIHVRTTAQIHNISGYWQGVIYQENCGEEGIKYAPYSMDLTQNGSVIDGTSYISSLDAEYFGHFRLVNSTFENDTFFFQDHRRLIDQHTRRGRRWCNKEGRLIYDPASESLIGLWEEYYRPPLASFCCPGTIELYRLSVLSETVFCAGDPVLLEVTGQNVTWYSSPDLDSNHILNQGNIFQPGIISSDTFFVTQTHYDVESPAYPISVIIDGDNATENCINNFQAPSSNATYCYTLSENLQSDIPDAPDLKVLENSSNQNGGFATVPLPENLCTNSGDMEVFQFEDNVGLEFQNTDDFIDCAYSVEFTLQFDELPWHTTFDNPWVTVFRTSNQDEGIFIYRNRLFGNLDIEFWDQDQPNRPLQAIPFPTFNTTDWFHFTITRDCQGNVLLYVNCQLFASFDDSTLDILGVSPEKGNSMIFFQDDPSVLQGDSAPGKVRDIKVSNFVLEEPAIKDKCDCICESLAESCTVEISMEETTCRPEEVGIFRDTVSFPGKCACSCDSIFVREVVLEVPIKIIDTLITADNGSGIGAIDVSIIGGAIPYQYIWNNDSMTQDINDLTAGNYRLTVTDNEGCMNVFDFFVPLEEPDIIKVPVTICEGSDYRGRTEDAVFLDTLIASDGRDSILEITLDVIEVNYTNFETSICANEDYLGYSLPGTYFDTLRSMITGCDSLITQIRLEVLGNPRDSMIVTICPGESYLGHTLPGIYRDTFPDAANGCDSILTLDLRINSLLRDTLEVSVCPGDSYNDLLPGMYLDTLQSVNGCDSIHTLVINEYPSIIVEDILVRHTTCRLDNGSIEVLATGGAGKLSYSKDGISFTERDSFADLAPGFYTIHIQDEQLCQEIIQVEIESSRPLTIRSAEILPATCGRSNGIVILKAKSDNPPLLYALGGFLTLGSDSLFTNFPPGIYPAVVTDAVGCVALDTIVIPEVPAPVIDSIQIFQATCNANNGKIIVTPQSTGSKLQFGLNSGNFQSDSIFTDLPPRIYTIKIKDEYDCVVETVVEINMVPTVNIQSVEIEPPSCDENDGMLFISIGNASGSEQFSIDSVNFQPDPLFDMLPSGDYTVYVKDKNGCMDSQSVELIAIDVPTITEIKPTPATPGIGDGQLEVFASGVGNLLYQINSDSLQSSNIFPGLFPGTYLVTVIDELGCKAQENIELPSKEPNQQLEEDLIFVPNAFSPNGDGINDVLQMFSSSEIELLGFKVFDRWGGLVFETNKVGKNQVFNLWDGQYNGQDAPVGVYVWMAMVLGAPGESLELSGDVLLGR